MKLHIQYGWKGMPKDLLDETLKWNDRKRRGILMFTADGRQETTALPEPDPQVPTADSAYGLGAGCAAVLKFLNAIRDPDIPVARLAFVNFRASASKIPFEDIREERSNHPLDALEMFLESVSGSIMQFGAIFRAIDEPAETVQTIRSGCLWVTLTCNQGE